MKDNMYPVTRKDLRAWIKDLLMVPCSFKLCGGPNMPYEHMRTCPTCIVIKDMQYHLDGTPRLPGHPGYKE